MEFHVQAIKEKVNKFDYAEADSIALNDKKDEHIPTRFKWQKTKMNMKKVSSANQQLPASGNATGINAFKIIKNVYPLSLKAKHQVFSILTTCQIFFLTWEHFFWR